MVSTGAHALTVAIDPNNEGVTLVRRLDHGIADQKATVSVDGQAVGTWLDAGADTVHNWRNSTFQIPGSVTKGKSTITVTITFVSSAMDWNEFYYWIYATVGGAAKQTDTLDVGNAASEQGHGYTIAGQTFAGARSFRYPGAQRGRLQIAWDDEPVPSVDSPVAEFFGTTGARNGRVRALPVGHDDGDGYSYFPMPFGSSAVVTLRNEGSEPIQGTFSLTHRPFTDDLRR